MNALLSIKDARVKRMKALTLTQPWATLVAIGAKQWETRSWPTNYRGELAIHAAKGFPGWAREECSDEPFKSALREMGYLCWQDLPVGCVIATCSLVSCLPTSSISDASLGDREIEFGDYTYGRYAFKLENVIQIKPFSCRGALGLWNWEHTR